VFYYILKLLFRYKIMRTILHINSFIQQILLAYSDVRFLLFSVVFYTLALSCFCGLFFCQFHTIYFQM